VSTGKWSQDVPGFVLQPVAANERPLLRRQVRVIGKAEPLWPSKWMAPIKYLE
jgi:hypothetical protein